MQINVSKLKTLCFFFIALLMLNCQAKQEKESKVAGPIEKIDEVGQKNDESQKIILFFGNSLTAGYGLEEEFAFPSLIQNKLDSNKLAYKIVNAGLSGETTADGVNRIDWILKQKIDVFVLELGANDMLRGLSVEETEKNLRLILEKVQNKYSDIPLVIAGMKAAPNMGEKYIQQFDAIYTKLSKEFNAGLVPFLLDEVAGIPNLNLKDGKHPNAEGQQIVAENVWQILRAYL